MSALVALAWSEALGGLLGAVVGGLATFGGVWLAQKGEANRDERNEERAQRRARQERLRVAVAELVARSLEAERMLSSLALTEGDKKSPDRIQRVWELAAKNLGDVSSSRVTLMLEKEEGLLASFDAVSQRLWRFQMRVLVSIHHELSDEGDVLTTERSISEMESIHAEVESLTGLAQRRLVELEKTMSSQVCPICGASMPPLEAGKAVKCPSCGARAVLMGQAVETDSAAPTAAVKAWSANALTLAGVIWALLVTVAGVVVAVKFAGWPWLAVYLGISVVLTLLGLTVGQQWVINRMGQLLAPHRSLKAWWRKRRWDKQGPRPDREVG